LKFKLDFEKIYLIIIFFFLLWAGAGNLFDHKINHDFPYAYLASDAFQHQIRAESIKQMGNYRYEAPYIAGGFEDAIGFYPPVMYHLDVIMSNITGIEVYDIIYLLTFIIVCFAVLIFYFIIRRFNKQVAILALPLSLLLFSKGPGIGPYALFTWGSWPLIFGQFFFICFFWYFTNYNLKNSWIFLGLFLSAITMQHQTELLFGAFFIIILSVIWIIKKELTLEKIKHFVKAGILFLFVSIYPLIIFRFTFLKSQTIELFTVITTTSTDQTFYLNNFGAILIIIIVGMIMSFFILRKKNSIPIIMSFFIFVVGFGNYIGLGRHAFKTRTFWPLYLSLFMGIAIYYLAKQVIKKWKTPYSILIAIPLLLIFSGIINIPTIPHVEQFSSSGLLDEHHWEGLLWLRDNTPQDAKILYLYGDPYYQHAVLRNAFRVPYLVSKKAYIPNLQNRVVNRHLKINLVGDNRGVYYAYRKSLFDYGYHETEEGKEYFATERDMCDFDYIVIDKQTAQPIIAQYNLFIANLLLNNTYINPVFDNPIVLIVKNENREGDCIAEQTTF